MNEPKSKEAEIAAENYVKGQFVPEDGIEPGTIAWYRHEGFIAGAQWHSTSLTTALKERDDEIRRLTEENEYLKFDLKKMTDKYNWADSVLHNIADIPITVDGIEQSKHIATTALTTQNGKD